jgi:trk/ktr system potassium uptake protein
MKVLLAGASSSLRPLCDSFMSKGWQVVAVHPDREQCERLVRNSRALVVCGDPSLPEVLDDAGIRDADAVVAATPRDSDNLAICDISYSEFGVKNRLALVNSPGNELVFEKLGIRSFSPNAAIASLIEQMADLEEITGIGALADGRIQLAELRVQPGWPCVGIPLRSLGMPEGSLVAALLRADKATIPSGATILLAGDRAVVLATASSYGAALEKLSGSDTGRS